MKLTPFEEGIEGELKAVTKNPNAVWLELNISEEIIKRSLQTDDGEKMVFLPEKNIWVAYK